MGIWDQYRYKFTLSSSSRIAKRMRRLANEMRKLNAKEKRDESEIKSIEHHIEEAMDTTKPEELARHLQDVSKEVERFVTDIKKLRVVYDKHITKFSDDITKGEQLLHRELEQMKKFVEDLNKLAEEKKITRPFANKIIGMLAEASHYISGEISELAFKSAMDVNGLRSVGPRFASEKRVYKGIRKSIKELRSLIMETESLEDELTKMFENGKISENVMQIVNKLIARLKELVDGLSEEETDLKLQMFRFSQHIHEQLDLMDYIINKFEASIKKAQIKGELLKKYNGLLAQLKEARKSIDFVLTDEIKRLLHSVRIQSKSEAREANKNEESFKELV